jgi:hypothetical protein
MFRANPLLHGPTIQLSPIISVIGIATVLAMIPACSGRPTRDVGSSDGYASWPLFATSFAITDERLVVPVTCSVPGTPK